MICQKTRACCSRVRTLSGLIYALVIPKGNIIAKRQRDMAPLAMHLMRRRLVRKDELCLIQMPTILTTKMRLQVMNRKLLGGEQSISVIGSLLHAWNG